MPTPPSQQSRLPRSHTHPHTYNYTRQRNTEHYFAAYVAISPSIMLQTKIEYILLNEGHRTLDVGHIEQDMWVGAY